MFFFSLDLVENFDEASKNEANWTKHHFLNKVKTWKGNMELLFYIVTALIFFFFPDDISTSVIFENSLNLQLFSHCLYTILFLWPGWTNLCFEISQIANESLPRHNFWVTCIQAKHHLYWILTYNKNIKRNFLVWLFCQKSRENFSVISQKRSCFSAEYPPFAVKLASKTFPVHSGAFWSEYIWNDGPVCRSITYALSHFNLLNFTNRSVF